MPLAPRFTIYIDPRDIRFPYSEAAPIVLEGHPIYSSLRCTCAAPPAPMLSGRTGNIAPEGEFAMETDWPSRGKRVIVTNPEMPPLTPNIVTTWAHGWSDLTTVDLSERMYRAFTSMPPGIYDGVFVQPADPLEYEAEWVGIDVLAVAGASVMHEPYWQRRVFLEAAVAAARRRELERDLVVRVAASTPEPSAAVVDGALSYGQSMVFKRIDAPYVPGASAHWISVAPVGGVFMSCDSTCGTCGKPADGHWHLDVTIGRYVQSKKQDVCPCVAGEKLIHGAMDAARAKRLPRAVEDPVGQPSEQKVTLNLPPGTKIGRIQ